MTMNKIPQTFLEQPNYITSQLFNKTPSTPNFFLSHRISSSYYNPQMRNINTNSLHQSIKTNPEWNFIMKINPHDINSINPYLNKILSLQRNEINSFSDIQANQLTSILKTISQSKENPSLPLTSIHFIHKKKNSLPIKPLYMSYNNTTQITTPQNIKHYTCKYCKGKNFLSQHFLEEHLQRRHLIYLNPSYHKRFKSDINKSIISIKESVELSIFNMEMESNLNFLKKRINFIENSLHCSSTIGLIGNVENNIERENEYSNNNNKNKKEKNNSKLLHRVMKKLKNNIEKSGRDFNNKLKNLKDEMDEFKLNISNELSNVKQAQSFKRALLAFEDNDTKGHLYLSKEGRQNKLRSVKILPRNKNKETFASKEIEVEMKTTQNIQKITTQDNSSDDNKEKDIEQQSKKKRKKNLVINKEVLKEISSKSKKISNKNSSILSQTQEEREFANFYRKFKIRDKGLYGRLEDYLIKIVPHFFTISKNYIGKEIHKLSEHNIKESTYNEVNTIKQIDSFNKEQLINLIKRLYGNIGDKSTISDFYGYYSKNLDFLLNTKSLIDEASHLYFKNKKEKLKQSEEEMSSMSFGKLFDIINYNVCTSGTFSFKGKEKE